MSIVPEVSVVIPVFNGEAHLAGSIDSALHQSLPPMEILIFDNGSTDRTREIACRLLPAEAVTSFADNAGAVVNFNRSIQAAQGEFVAWLAADDRLAPTHLERCVTALLADPDAPACLPGIRYLDESGAPVRDHVDHELASNSAEVRLRSFLRRPRWTEVYCLYRRDALLASPMMMNHFGADVLLTWWFLLRGHLAVVDSPLLEYRTYPTKSVAGLAHSLNPRAPVANWRKARLWHRLWQMTGDAGVESRVVAVARRELLLVFLHPSWLGHLVEDIMQRWPRLTAPLRPLTARVRRRRQRGRSRKPPSRTSESDSLTSE